MKRKTALIIFLSLVFLCFLVVYFSALRFRPTFAYTANPMSGTAYPENVEERFHKTATKEAQCCVVGEFIERYFDGKKDVWEFKVKEVVFGEIEEEIVKVIDPGVSHVYIVTDESYIAGNEYILLLGNPHRKGYEVGFYTIMQGTYIPLSDVNQSNWSYGEIKFGAFATARDVKNYLRENYFKGTGNE